MMCLGESNQNCQDLPKYSGEYLSSVHVDYSKGSCYTKLPYHGKTSQDIGMIYKQREIHLSINYFRMR